MSSRGRIAPRRALSLVTVAVLLGPLGCSLLRSSGESGARMEWTLYPAGHIPWRGRPDWLPPGAELAVLDGDPGGEGAFTIRLDMPNGYRIPPHWHDDAERLTVIAGTFNVGIGDKLDARATQSLPTGSYSAMAAGLHHFAWTRGRTIVQITGTGPWSVHYVNEADDPRVKTGRKENGS